ncbi:crossover junction endodeoxyribonuclease RuvC [Candidatus Microgenomates bacterium]|nr:crossover junction endodeoxyribonuclease RuvC [Candidatus Microgenomates bacterium]
MRILGIDPGTATTGLGLIESNGHGISIIKFDWIETLKGGKPEQRLNEIYHKMKEQLNQLQPDVIAIEQVFFATNVRTAIAVSQAKGVIMLACAHLNLPLTEFSPMHIKKVVTGNGRAKKDEMKKVVRNLLQYSDGTRLRSPNKKKTHFDDVADALAIAICYAKDGQSSVA